MLTSPPTAICLGCHDIASEAGRFAHAPVAAGNCTACHDAHRSERPSLLAAPTPLLCTICHEDVADDTGAVSVHPPAQDDCLVCHRPHGGDSQAFLTEPTSTLCFQCHDEQSKELQDTHLDRDLTKLHCSNCHEPHRSTQPKLIRANQHPPFAERDCSTCHEGSTPITDQKALCFMCHDDVANPGKHVHAPFADGDCTGCHDPHAARGEHLLTAGSTDAACAACHDPSDLYPNADLAHTPVREGKCAECHDPHGSDQPALLKQPKNELCLTCHASMAELEKKPHLHPPFKGGECLSCHDVHGTDQPFGLTAAVPALCAECHDLKDAALSGKHLGYDMTKVDCTGCHDPHASTLPALMLEEPHPPFEQRRCATCHAGTGAVKEGGRRQGCLGCHPALREDLKLGLPHAPLADEGDCTTCHTPARLVAPRTAAPAPGGRVRILPPEGGRPDRHVGPRPPRSRGPHLHHVPRPSPRLRRQGEARAVGSVPPVPFLQGARGPSARGGHRRPEPQRRAGRLRQLPRSSRNGRHEAAAGRSGRPVVRDLPYREDPPAPLMAAT